MAVSIQVAVLRLGLGNWSSPTEAEIGNRIRLRRGIRDGLLRVRAGGDLSKAAEQLSAGVDAELKSAKRGLVETWYSGGYVAWPEVHRVLTERDVKGVEWQKAHELAQSGAAVLIDVREAQSYAKIHAEGAFGAPLFQLIQGNDLKANIRRLGYALLTDFAGTERNPNFIDQALQAVGLDKQKPVIVICDIGGTLSTFVERTGPKAKKYADPQRRFGRASRSLRAVFELQEVGFENVSYLTGGFSTWTYEGLPTEGAQNH